MSEDPQCIVNMYAHRFGALRLHLVERSGS